MVNIIEPKEIRYEGVNLIEEFTRCCAPLPRTGFPCDSPLGHSGEHRPYTFDDGRFRVVSESKITVGSGPNQRPEDQAWIEYPVFPDAALRKFLFWSEEDTNSPDDKGVMSHPAKAPVSQMEDLIRLVSKPGDTILDIFGGTGTTLIGARERRRVVLMEINPMFLHLQQQSIDKMKRKGILDVRLEPMLLAGDNRQLLKGWAGANYFDHIMFSPPYSDILSFKVKAASTAHLGGSTYVSRSTDTFGDYTTVKGNLGELPDFKFRMEMRKVYQAVFDALKPGGTMTTIMGDMMKDGKRVRLSDNVLKACKAAGFGEPIEWLYRYMGGTGFKKDWMKKGKTVVLNEDLIVFRKPL